MKRYWPVRVGLASALAAAGALLPNAVRGAEAPAQPEGSWKAVAAGSRFFHTATLLRNGKVLVSGGCTKLEAGRRCLQASSSAEIFDPATGSWSAAAGMLVARAGHTATLLEDGKVLAAGGCVAAEGQGVPFGCSVAGVDPATADQALMAGPQPELREVARRLIGDSKNTGANPAEIYDPQADRWTPAAPSPLPVPGNVAMLLPKARSGCGAACGGVLVWKSLWSKVFLFAPGPQAWSPAAGSLASGVVPPVPESAGHTVTGLEDGRVLMISQGTRLYDPPSDTLRPAAEGFDQRQFHTATLLPGGKVLVAGGLRNFDPAGVRKPLPLRSLAELFDPKAAGPQDAGQRGAWQVIRGPGQARYAHAAALLPSGKVLLAGGTDGENLLSSAELYEPAAGRWRPAGSMATPRGGRGVSEPEFKDSQGRSAPPYPGSAEFSATPLADGRVLVTGGADSAEIYTPHGVDRVSSTSRKAGNGAGSLIPAVIAAAGLAVLALVATGLLKKRAGRKP